MFYVSCVLHSRSNGEYFELIKILSMEIDSTTNITNPEALKQIISELK
jgi:hypothetical protein